MDSDKRNEARMIAQAIPTRGVGGAMAGYAPSEQMVAEKNFYRGEDQCAAQEPLRVRLQHRLSTISADAEKLMRIEAILQAHPEFETFMEFNDLLNRTRLR
jgi:hypothetical protein